MKYLGPVTDSKDIATKGYVDGQVGEKQDTLVSGTNIKTINNNSILGGGDITVSVEIDSTVITLYQNLGLIPSSE